MIDKLPKLAVMAVPGLSGSPCAVANVSGKARSVAITSLMITSAMLRGPRHKSVCAHIGSICTYVKRMNADGSRRRFGSGQILRNPFFVNRPVLAHTILRGRFRQFSSRHHQHFLPIIVVGFKILSGSSGRTPLICPFVWGFASSGDSVTGPSSMAMGKCLFTAHL